MIWLGKKESHSVNDDKCHRCRFSSCFSFSSSSSFSFSFSYIWIHCLFSLFYPFLHLCSCIPWFRDSWVTGVGGCVCSFVYICVCLIDGDRLSLSFHVFITYIHQSVYTHTLSLLALQTGWHRLFLLTDQAHVLYFLFWFHRWVRLFYVIPVIATVSKNIAFAVT